MFFEVSNLVPLEKLIEINKPKLAVEKFKDLKKNQCTNQFFEKVKNSRGKAVSVLVNVQKQKFSCQMFHIAASSAWITDTQLSFPSRLVIM